MVFPLQCLAFYQLKSKPSFESGGEVSWGNYVLWLGKQPESLPLVRRTVFLQENSLPSNSSSPWGFPESQLLLPHIYISTLLQSRNKPIPGTRFYLQLTAIYSPVVILRVEYFNISLKSDKDQKHILTSSHILFDIPSNSTPCVLMSWRKMAGLGCPHLCPHCGVIGWSRVHVMGPIFASVTSVQRSGLALTACHCPIYTRFTSLIFRACLCSLDLAGVVGTE